MCYKSSLGDIQRQKEELARLRRLRAPRGCYNCRSRAKHPVFNDVLCICLIDGHERGKYSICESWNPAPGQEFLKNGYC